MGNFTQKKWGASSNVIGENGGEGGRIRVMPRIPGTKPIRLQANDTHYLDMSFECYPCKCKFNSKLTVKLALRCHECLMSTQSRITHMKSKI